MVIAIPRGSSFPRRPGGRGRLVASQRSYPFSCLAGPVSYQARLNWNGQTSGRASASAAKAMIPPTLAQLLTSYRTQLVSRFIAEVQQRDLSPPGTSRSLLIDHIPKFLDEIVAELTRGEPVRTTQDVIDTSETARQHGQQRWSLGYDLGALTREYGVLRHCILLMARETNAHLSIDDHDILGKCLSVGVTQATTEYVAYRDEELDQQKANLEFLAEAGQILSSSLDYRSTLSKLTRLLVPRMADFCTVHLEGHGSDEIPLLHVDAAKEEFLRASYKNYPLVTDSRRGYAHAERAEQPVLVSAVEPSSFDRMALTDDQRALVRAIHPTSWLIVPLAVQGSAFGALTLGYSDSSRRYREQDLVLASEVARRAAVAIDNARLYELSQSARSRVEAATRAKDEFVAMVSHELRTPLNAIVGWLRLMRSGTLSPAKREHALDVIQRNAHAQSQLVADLLDISRILTGKIRINPSQVDLGNVVDMAIEGVRPAADAKRVQIAADIERDHSLMRGDGDRLQQVAWNLLANAVKFTPKNGIIQVRVRRVESDLELTVEDNGVGIAPEFLPYVFDSFRQSDGTSARSHGGLGIGLSIAKHIVELHGGSVDVQSLGLGRGALFRVLLPISPLVSATIGVPRVPATQHQDVRLTHPLGLEGIRVLVVDDEPDARELVAYVFEEVGMEVRAAASAADALKELQSFTPQVIVSDIGMPHEDGYQLIRSVRTLFGDDKKDTPAIALTAFARNEDRTRALVEGFNLHMAKPVEPNALVDAVAQLAGRAHR
jgi:signal transduction histidine kinase/CheY-like chemotaxis protein